MFFARYSLLITFFPASFQTVTSDTLILCALSLAAYLVGSIPSGLLLARRWGGVDVRRRGSGNIGATNVARVAGARLGAVTLAADLLKGWLPAWTASRLAPEEPAWAAAAALLAFLGHLFPLFTRFREGGKGVATAAGAFLALAPGAVAAGGAVFALVFAAGRRVSAASLAAALTLPAAAWLTGRPPVVWLGAGVIAALIFWRHAGNIRRLIAGTEPKFRAGPFPP